MAAPGTLQGCYFAYKSVPEDGVLARSCCRGTGEYPGLMHRLVWLNTVPQCALKYWPRPSELVMPKHATPFALTKLCCRMQTPIQAAEILMANGDAQAAAKILQDAAPHGLTRGRCRGSCQAGNHDDRY